MIAIMCQGATDTSRLDGFALVIEERNPAKREPHPQQLHILPDARVLRHAPVVS
jgi:hypothetical protein